MSEIIAIDVALMLPPEVEDLAMGLNKELIAGQRAEGLVPAIVLDKNPCLPHASLVMAAVSRANVEKIAGELRELVNGLMPMELKIIGTYHMGTNEKPYFSGLEIEKNYKLQKLHEEIARVTKPYHVRDVNKEMFITGAETDDFIPPYVGSFFDEQCGEKFWPHITVGHGELSNVLPQSFVVSAVAICHLGRWGTCREVLVRAGGVLDR